MQRIIKNNEVIDETWHLLPKDVSFDDISNCDDLIVPLMAASVYGWTAMKKPKNWARTWLTFRSLP